jgi:hypothetical protein
MQTTLVCPNCYTQNNASFQFCGRCGTRLFTLCPNCNLANLTYEKYCRNCGNLLAEQSQQQTTYVNKLSNARWINKHPNFILLVGIVIGNLFALPGVLGISKTIIPQPIKVIFLIAGILIYWIMAGWMLKLKGRSLGHLSWIILVWLVTSVSRVLLPTFYTYIGMLAGIIVMVIWLCLSNKNKVK